MAQSWYYKHPHHSGPLLAGTIHVLHSLPMPPVEKSKL